MRKSRYTDSQIMAILKQNEEGTKVPDLRREHGMSAAMFYIRQYTGRSWGVSMACRFEKLARYARGWMNYYGISDYYRPVAELDHWLRRRVRMCYWKRWRRARTKVRHPLALGTGKRAAILTAISSKSYWRLSKTLATQTGMTNAWLESQGLVNICALWMKAHGYA